MSTLDKIYNVTVDVKNVEVEYNSHAKFFDDDRETSIIKVRLLNNKTPIDLEGCIVEAYFILADNSYHSESCKIVNSSEGEIELNLCQKCLVIGKNTFRISISKDNEISNTPIMIYEVKKGLYSDEPNFNDDPLTPMLSQMLLDVKITQVNQIELQERYEQAFPKIEDKIQEVDNVIEDIRTDYDSLQKIIIDENASANLQNQINQTNSQLEHMTHKKYNVKDYGAKGDGLTDDSEAIRKCIEALPESNFELIFPPGVYMQGDGTYNTEDYENTTTDNVNKGIPIYFELKDKTNFRVSGYGATVKAHSLNGCIANNRGFDFLRCENFIVEGLTYDGNISDRKPAMGDPSGYNNQSGFNIGSCKNAILRDLTGINCCMDGFTIHSPEHWGGNGDWSEDITMYNCIARYNYRQGMSVISAKRVKIYDSEFSYTGTIYGTSPMAGIDFEEGYSSSYGRGQHDCLVSGCLFIDNKGSGVSLHYGTTNSSIVNSSFYKTGVFSPGGTLDYGNSLFNNKFYQAGIDVSGPDTIIKENTFYIGTQYYTIIRLNPEGVATNDKPIIFENNKVIGQLGENETVLKNGFSLFCSGATRVTNNIFIDIFHYLSNGNTDVCFYLRHSKPIHFSNNRIEVVNEVLLSNERLGNIDAFNVGINNYIDTRFKSIGFNTGRLINTTGIIDNCNYHYLNKSHSLKEYDFKAKEVKELLVPIASNVKIKIPGSYDAGYGYTEYIIYNGDYWNLYHVVDAHLEYGIINSRIKLGKITNKNGAMSIPIVNVANSNHEYVKIEIECTASAMDKYINKTYELRSTDEVYSETYELEPIYYRGKGSIKTFSNKQDILSAGYTGFGLGATYYNTTLKKMLVWNGTNFCDYMGNVVE